MLPHLTLALALAAPVANSPRSGNRTLWLVEPLYPKQEALVPRVEEAIGKLPSPEDRPSQLIGRAELTEALRGRSLDLDCVFKEKPCDDPRTLLMSELGVDQVVLIKAGQDEAIYRFKVVSFERATAKVTAAESSDTHFEKALRGALVKSVALTAMLEVSTAPKGALVYVDGELVGTTPLPPTQVLVGDRIIRIELALYTPVQRTEHIVIGEHLVLEPTLEVFGLRRRTWGFLSLGAGAAAAGAGAVLGVAAGEQARYARELPQLRETAYQRAAASAQTTARAADALYVTALATAAIGAWLVLFDDPIPVRARPAAPSGVSPRVGILPLPKGGALTVESEF